MSTKHLCKGDRVALVCASSAVSEKRLAPAVAAVKEMGLEPVLYPSCYYVNRHGGFAAIDAQRARDVTEAFSDPTIQGVVALRGGYGGGRLLPMLDWDAMAAAGKFFAGYSDVTALHIPLNNRGVVTWHTVMPSAEYDRVIDDYTMAELRWAIFGPGGRRVIPLPEGWETTTLVPGAAKGRLVGGNLSLVAASLGTPWEIQAEGNILFLEEVDEEPYRIDGRLTHLRNAGKLNGCAGVMLGYWTNCVPRDDKPTLPLDEVIRELLGGLSCPVWMGLPCGHSLPSMALPLGAEVCMDAGNKTLEVLE